VGHQCPKPAVGTSDYFEPRLPFRTGAKRMICTTMQSSSAAYEPALDHESEARTETVSPPRLVEHVTTGSIGLEVGG
jgi:hypothetical protein